jgi:hypothetical protein
MNCTVMETVLSSVAGPAISPGQERDRRNSGRRVNDSATDTSQRESSLCRTQCGEKYQWCEIVHPNPGNRLPQAAWRHPCPIPPAPQHAVSEGKTVKDERSPESAPSAWINREGLSRNQMAASPHADQRESDRVREAHVPGVIQPSASRHQPSKQFEPDLRRPAAGKHGPNGEEATAATSMAGSRTPMRPPHPRQRPRCATQLAIGNSSRSPRRRPHCAQLERPG